jgi:non-homologous end joining protein Ku
MAFRKGVVVQYGTIMVIVNVDSAVATEPGLKNVCLGNGVEHEPTALKQNLKCPKCGNTDAVTMKKARVEGKTFTVVSKEEIAEAKASTVGSTAEMIVLTAHPAEQVHSQSIQGGSVYQLTAGSQAMVPALSLVHDMIRRHSELSFTCLWTPASRPNFYEMRAFGDTLVMEQRVRPEDLKIVQQPLAPIDPAYQAQVDAILHATVDDFEPATYADAYRVKLDEVLASKEGQEGVLGEKSKSAPKVVAGAVDLSAMLGAGLKAAGLNNAA